MNVILNTVSGSWTQAIAGPVTGTQNFIFTSVLHAAGTFVDPVTVSNGVYLSGSYAAPAVGKFLQLKDNNDIVFYSKRQEVSDAPSATFQYVTHPITVQLPIYYFTSQNNAIIIINGVSKSN